MMLLSSKRWQRRENLLDLVKRRGNSRSQKDIHDRPSFCTIKDRYGIPELSLRHRDNITYGTTTKARIFNSLDIELDVGSNADSDHGSYWM